MSLRSKLNIMACCLAVSIVCASSVGVLLAQMVLPPMPTVESAAVTNELELPTLIPVVLAWNPYGDTNCGLKLVSFNRFTNVTYRFSATNLQVATFAALNETNIYTLTATNQAGLESPGTYVVAVPTLSYTITLEGRTNLISGNWRALSNGMQSDLPALFLRTLSSPKTNWNQ
jgi:hypothetical protein